MKCPKCKGEIFEGQYQCHHCGTWIPSVKEDTKTDKPKKATKKEK